MPLSNSKRRVYKRSVIHHRCDLNTCVVVINGKKMDYVLKLETLLCPSSALDVKVFFSLPSSTLVMPAKGLCFVMFKIRQAELVTHSLPS